MGVPTSGSAHRTMKHTTESASMLELHSVRVLYRHAGKIQLQP